MTRLDVLEEKRKETRRELRETLEACKDPEALRKHLEDIARGNGKNGTKVKVPRMPEPDRAGIGGKLAPIVSGVDQKHNESTPENNT